MSDPNDAPRDPIDEAYVQAEATLADEAARAARRARLLAAVQAEPAAVPAAPFLRRQVVQRGGWLVAAAVAGLGIFLANRPHQSALPVAPPAPPPAISPPGASLSASQIAPPPIPLARTPIPRAVPAAPEIAEPRIAAPPPPVRALTPQEASPLPPPPSAAPSARAADSSAVEDVVVTGSRISSAKVAERSASPAPDPAARLLAAAAAGRLAEVEALLGRGVPVDAEDAQGDTALIRSVLADQPAVAAFLRRRGASLDHQNHAGHSARDIAADKGDAKLTAALGLDR